MSTSLPQQLHAPQLQFQELPSQLQQPTSSQVNLQSRNLLMLIFSSYHHSLVELLGDGAGHGYFASYGFGMQNVNAIYAMNAVAQAQQEVSFVFANCSTLAKNQARLDRW